MIVYKTTNLINGRFYIGQDKNNNPTYIGSGKLLRQAVEKHGIDNFVKEIIDIANTLDELNEKEIYWIKKLNSQERGIGYNIADGGTGGDTFTNNPNKEEIRKKISAASIISNNRNREVHRANTTNLWKNEIFKNKVTHVLKTMWYDVERKTKMTNALKNIKHTKEWNAKVGKNNIIRFHGKKILYFLNEGIPLNTIAAYFDLSTEKLANIKVFDKEPSVEVLLQCYELYKEGKKISKIRNILANAPSDEQIRVFIELKIASCEIVRI